jgi:hypothetical protein
MEYVASSTTSRVDIERAKAFVSLTEIDNDALKDALVTIVAAFLAKWSDDVPGKLDFNREALRVLRSFRGLSSTCQEDAGNLADAFCLAIRQELSRVEDKAINREVVTGAVPSTPSEVATWFAALEKAHTDAVVSLLWGDLPSITKSETNVSPRSRALYFRHKIRATVSLYHGIREVYEAHLPKAFGRRANLPAYYLEAPAVPPSPAQSATKIEQVHKRIKEAGTPIEGERLPKSIDALFTYQFKTVDCDELARMLDLCPPEDEFERDSNANVKIWAVIKALSEGDFLAVPDSEFAIALGKRYGYNVSAKLTKQRENKRFQSYRQHLTNTIRRWKSAGRIR